MRKTISLIFRRLRVKKIRILKKTGLSGNVFFASLLWISLMALVSWQIGGLVGNWGAGITGISFLWFAAGGGVMMENETKSGRLESNNPTEQFVWLFFPAFFTVAVGILIAAILVNIVYTGRQMCVCWRDVS